MKPKTTEQICEAVALDLKARKITHRMVAESIGKTKATVSNQISGKKPFSKSMAELFAKALKYNTNFLLYGIGELRSDRTVPRSVLRIETENSTLNEPMLASLLEISEYLLHLAGNQDAIDAWNALLDADFNMYQEKISALMIANKHNGRVSWFTAKYITEHIAEPKVFDGFFGTIRAEAVSAEVDLKDVEKVDDGKRYGPGDLDD